MSLREKYTPQKIETTGLTVTEIEEQKESRPLVLHCGITAPTYSSTGISNGWRQNGYDVAYFNWQGIRFDEGLIGLQERLAVKTQTEKPDIVFLHVQNEGIIDKETAAEISKASFVINYTFDMRSKEKTEWMYELAPLIGLTVFACKDDYEEAIRRGINNVMYAHSSCDMDIFRKLELPDHITKGVPEIVFVGNNTTQSNLNFENAQQRFDMVKFLKQEFGERFGVYGIGWPSVKSVNNQDKINIYNSCKIAIAQNQFIRKNYCSDRQWEIMACGTFAAVQGYAGVDKELKDGINCAIWENFNELKFIIEHFLENESERKAIAAAGEELVRDDHNWTRRIKQILESVKLFR